MCKIISFKKCPLSFFLVQTFTLITIIFKAVGDLYLVHCVIIIFINLTYEKKNEEKILFHVNNMKRY